MYHFIDSRNSVKPNPLQYLPKTHISNLRCDEHWRRRIWAKKRTPRQKKKRCSSPFLITLGRLVLITVNSGKSGHLITEFSVFSVLYAIDRINNPCRLKPVTYSLVIYWTNWKKMKVIEFLIIKMSREWLSLLYIDKAVVVCMNILYTYVIACIW